MKTKDSGGLDKDLGAIEKQMKDIIDSDDDLRKLYTLVSSVVGVGFVTAVNLIMATSEFKLFHCHRKFACYVGVAPFEHKSGSSIRGKTRVSLIWPIKKSNAIFTWLPLQQLSQMKA